MTFNQPLVTLIFLSYNNSRFLDESIKSLFWQSYSNVQIVICDDCSSDDSV
ncbi:MAG: glycosyltransferase, partial [Shewanella sp.]